MQRVGTAECRVMFPSAHHRWEDVREVIRRLWLGRCRTFLLLQDPDPMRLSHALYYSTLRCTAVVRMRRLGESFIQVDEGARRNTRWYGQEGWRWEVGVGGGGLHWKALINCLCLVENTTSPLESIPILATCMCTAARVGDGNTAWDEEGSHHSQWYGMREIRLLRHPLPAPQLSSPIGGVWEVLTSR